MWDRDGEVNVNATVLDHHPIDHGSYDLLLVFK